MRDLIRQGFTLFSALGQIAAVLIFNDRFNEVSDTSQSLGAPIYFVPDDPTFAVWGVIVFTSIAYAIYQAIPNQRERTIHRRIGWWMGVNTLFFSLWLAASVQSNAYGSPDFQPGFVLLTVVIIVGMLFTLTNAFVRLREMSDEFTTADLWLAQVPVSIYFAWINVATIANTTSYLYGIGLGSEQYGAIVATVMLAVATLLTSVMMLYSRANVGTLAYTAVVVWAFLGIYRENADQSALVATSSLVGAAVVALVTTFHLINRRPLLLNRRSAAAG